MVNDLQLTLSRKDFNELTDSLKIALDNHLAWLSDLNHAMICQPELLANFCCCDKPYRHCKLGKWYYSVQDENITSHPEFIRIGEKHKKLHQTVCQLVVSFAKYGKPTSDVYQAYKNAEDVFLNLLKTFLHSSIEASVNTDFLTELPNRKALELILKQEHARLKRKDISSSIAIMDIDFFKQINDKYGHPFGDKVLKEISTLLINNVRDCDFAVRYGGEEFVIYFPETEPEITKMITEKLRDCIEKHTIKTEFNGKISVTCSFGISIFFGNKPINDSISHADEALYTAKSQGRNQVIVSLK